MPFPPGTPTRQEYRLASTDAWNAVMFSWDPEIETRPSPLLVRRSVSGGFPRSHCVNEEPGAEQERETLPPVGTAWLRGSSTVSCEPGLENNLQYFVAQCQSSIILFTAATGFHGKD